MQNGFSQSPQISAPAKSGIFTSGHSLSQTVWLNGNVFAVLINYVVHVACMAVSHTAFCILCISFQFLLFLFELHYAFYFDIFHTFHTALAHLDHF